MKMIDRAREFRVPDAQAALRRRILEIQAEAAASRREADNSFRRYENMMAWFAVAFALIMIGRILWAWHTGAVHG